MPKSKNSGVKKSEKHKFRFIAQSQNDARLFAIILMDLGCVKAPTLTAMMEESTGEAPLFLQDVDFWDYYHNSSRLKMDDNDLYEILDTGRIVVVQ